MGGLIFKAIILALIFTLARAALGATTENENPYPRAEERARLLALLNQPQTIKLHPRPSSL